MKLRLYWTYPTRSLVRGGQRTLLAIFCVAVGVLAIVALQLVGGMIDGALTSNVREGNGGDISIRSDINPLTADQIATFDQLKAGGTITDYTAVSAHTVQSVDNNGQSQIYLLRAVDPAVFPIAGSPLFLDPGDGSLSSLLSGNTVVITEDLQKQLGVKVGDTISGASDDGRALQVTVGGIIASNGFYARPQMLMALDAYGAVPSSSGLPVTYGAVYANVPGDTDANAASAKNVIEQQLPLATVTTTKDALQQNQDQVQQIRYFLQIVGLLALLIGGVGIINTMQVLLRRRRTEIAMLKTAGYRQRHLYALFGIETGLLGLIGGVIGSAAGIGVAFLVKNLVASLFQFTLPTTIDPMIVASGVAIGFFTALIFGLMPIVQAGQVRPQAVLRELPEGAGVRSTIVSVLLAGLLALLFFGLALSILQNLGVAIASVVGVGLFLLGLSVFFTLIVFLISKLPVLERFTWWYALLIIAGVLVSAAITYAVPAFGILFLALSLCGIVVVLLPRTWKANVKMALRNIGRQKTRTVTTLVALFIGIFAIGLILVLGQGIKDKINEALATQVKYNSFIIAGSASKADVDRALQNVSGIQGQQVNTIAQAVPVAVNGTPISQILQGTLGGSSGTSTGREETLSYLSSIEGYDLANSNVPDVTIVQGSNLSAVDVGTNHVIVPQRATLPPLNLKVGDTITLADQVSKKPITVTVVGVYTGGGLAGGGLSADNSVAQKLANNQPFYVYQLKLDPKQANQKLHEVQQAVPSIQTFSVVDLTLLLNSLLNNLIIMLTAIASLAMIAGVIIIANAVALAMLERRRELGILKSVGYTSRSVLSEVLLENGIVGFTGALLAMLLVTLALTVLGKIVFKIDFGVGAPIVLGIIAASAAVCMVVAGFVAWGATRVRPLEVLRYE
jgi:predicted lysophospholipase L1 biosynthesis ABC-type transport system permease subunit